MIDELKQWEYDRGYEKGKTEVLDKIRAEISKLKGTFPNEYYLKIIDKYTKGDSE